MLKVSVIIPFYGVEKYFEDCLKSVQGQTYKNFEAILVDDGSKDNSIKIAEKFVKADKRFKLVRQENKGLNIARATGFENSNGDFITFLDSDDVLDYGFLQQMVEPLKDKEVDFTICAYRNFEGSVDFQETKDEAILSEKIKKDEILHRFLIGNSEIENIFLQIACGKMFRRKTIEKVDFEKSNYRINEDEFMSPMFYADVKKSVRIIKNPLYLYRLNPTSIMSSIKKKYQNYFRGEKISRFKMIENMMNFRLEIFPDFFDEIVRNFALHFYIFSRDYLSGSRKCEDKDEMVEILSRNIEKIKKAFKKYHPTGIEADFYNFIFEKGAEKILNFKDIHPKISVIVPVNGSEKYLEICLNSIKNQTHLNLEAILVVQNSKKIPEICRNFTEIDERFKIYSANKTKDSSLRNFVIKNATGEYLTFISGNDYYEFDAFEKMTKSLKDSADLICYTFYIKKGDDFLRQDLGRFKVPTNGVFKKGDISKKQIKFFAENSNYLAGKFFKTSLIKGKNIRFMKNYDPNFMIKAFCSAKKIAFHDDTIYIHRESEDKKESINLIKKVRKIVQKKIIRRKVQEWKVR